jgi:tetratricopeptide (TPR) repeat protein
LAPDAAGTWRTFGDALLADGMLAEAAGAFRRAVALDGKGSQSQSLGQCLLELGDPAGAVESFRDFLDREPSSALAHANLALGLRLRGDFGGALAAVARVRDLGGTPWGARCDAWQDEIERAGAGARALASLVDGVPTMPEGHAPVTLALAHCRDRAGRRCTALSRQG